MAKLLYTKRDVEVLVERLESRANSVMLFDMPKLASDMRSAAGLLRWLINHGLLRPRSILMVGPADRHSPLLILGRPGMVPAFFFVYSPNTPNTPNTPKF
jgi:hypothetical protein